MEKSPLTGDNGPEYTLQIVAPAYPERPNTQTCRHIVPNSIHRMVLGPHTITFGHLDPCGYASSRLYWREVEPQCNQAGEDLRAVLGLTVKGLVPEELQCSWRHRQRTCFGLFFQTSKKASVRVGSNLTPTSDALPKLAHTREARLAYGVSSGNKMPDLAGSPISQTRGAQKRAPKNMGHPPKNSNFKLN